MSSAARHALHALLVVVLAVTVVVAVVVVVDTASEHQQATAEAPRGPSGSLGHVGPPAETHDFRRFRIGAVDGQRLTPNATDFASRSVGDGPLLLFLPATRARPADYRTFLSVASQAGYNVLGLDYWNLGTTLSGTCENDPRCYTQVQRNRFDGTDASQFSDVGPAGSITARLRDAVAHLSSADPAGGWNRFVDGAGHIAWDHIVVAGHSQGGGEAAFIAHIRPVLGALMFSSPVESDGAAHAAWMDRPGVTPITREYAIDDVRDVFGPRIRGSWRVLGLDGPHGPSVTTTRPPSGDPHAILTRLDVGDPDQAHSLIIDDATPLQANGTPRMLPLWHWMLTRFPLPQTHEPNPTRSAAPTPSRG
ncbi:hypothetical protein [Curtobacterium sp. MCBD17_028]|uniref:BPSS1187 family protein n=1 Tax=Curtobacterium sp. MCBD17_028 TaxID=2175670 RepID=UPI000DAA00E8|nr:hypothetical protein [Curtobacterium sp. MCBD17_028]PZE28799.1 hypothetical protein DEI86_03240 [Curtobacterium sp. MCBD17_028]